MELIGFRLLSASIAILFVIVKGSDSAGEKMAAGKVALIVMLAAALILMEDK